MQKKNVWFFSLIEKKCKWRVGSYTVARKAIMALDREKEVCAVLRRDKRGPDQGAALTLGQGELFLSKNTGMVTQYYPMPTAERPLTSPWVLLRGPVDIRAWQPILGGKEQFSGADPGGKASVRSHSQSELLSPRVAPGMTWRPVNL